MQQLLFKRRIRPTLESLPDPPADKVAILRRHDVKYRMPKNLLRLLRAQELQRGRRGWEDHNVFRPVKVMLLLDHRAIAVQKNSLGHV